MKKKHISQWFHTQRSKEVKSLCSRWSGGKYGVVWTSLQKKNPRSKFRTLPTPFYKKRQHSFLLFRLKNRERERGRRKKKKRPPQHIILSHSSLSGWLILMRAKGGPKKSFYMRRQLLRYCCIQVNPHLFLLLFLFFVKMAMTPVCARTTPS